MRFKRLLISAGSKGKFIVMFVHEKLLGATNIKNVNPCKNKKKKQVTYAIKPASYSSCQRRTTTAYAIVLY